MYDDWASAILSEGFMVIGVKGAEPHSRVYRAYDKKLDNLVAVKKIDISYPGHGEELKRELGNIKRARHLNILPIFYALVRPRMALVVMPTKPCNLYDIMPLRYEMNVKISTFYNLAVQMLSALTYLQEEGMSHRNIKPTNVLFTTSGPGFHFQLTDFALTEPAAAALSDRNRASFIYKAPETYIDSYPLTTKQDVWSLFVTLAVTCGCLSERDLRSKAPAAIVRTVVEAGVQMYELEAMAQQNPTLRASGAAMFHQLRPKERVNIRGEVDYPEVSPNYVGLYGSGRLEQDIMIPLGPAADVRTLAGPLGLGSGMPPLTPVEPEPYQQFLPSDLGLFDETMPVAVEAPAERMLPSPQSEPLKDLPDLDEFQFAQYDNVNQRCLASCCNNNTSTPHSLSWDSSSQTLSPNAPSFVPVSPPLAPTTPQPLCPITPTETWDIWGVYKTSGGFNFANREYVRPYPMACDRQEDQEVEDVPLEDYRWDDDEDGLVRVRPWKLPPMSCSS